VNLVPGRAGVSSYLDAAKEAPRILVTGPIFAGFLAVACCVFTIRGELIALKGIDLDFINRLIDVQRNLSRGKITLPKNGKTRKVDMSKQLATVLGELLSRRRAAALRKEMEKPAEERRDVATVVNEVMEGWPFTTPEIISKSEATKRRGSQCTKPRGGTQLDPSNLRKVFTKLLTDAKVRRVRFHDLRHTFATMIQQGEGLAYVRARWDTARSR
jgi:integrase